VTQSAQFSSLVQSFFAQHLCEHKQVSPRTVTVYRDTFRLLFAFMKERTGRAPSELAIADLDAPAILAFLDHLETARSNHARSRNLRLSAIRSFFRYASLRDVEHLAIGNRVLAIPTKRTAHPLLTFLSRPEMDAILAATDQSTWLGGRNHALLLTMYNTGARASELTALTCGQFSFGTTTLVQLHGKGRKERTVPLWPQTAKVLTRWFQILNTDDRGFAFPSVHRTRLSADALNHLLQQAVRRATDVCPDLARKRVTPHVVRHTTALHLLQAGVDIAVIALWLGHESIETTHGYVEADLEMKQRALEKLTPAMGTISRFKASDSLLQFLSKL
jgi:site-specific recombinase XerD